MMSEMNSNKTLNTVAYASLIGSIIIFMSLASIEWGVFIAWPILVIGFVVWAVLVTIADKNNGSDKKVIYQRNQKIFLVLLLVIVLVTLYSTVGTSFFSR